MRRFRIYPERDRPEFFEVRIFRSLARMRRALQRHDRRLHVAPQDWSKSVAVCRGLTVQRLTSGHWRNLPLLGILFFARRQMSAEVITHEVTHAAVVWARRRRLRGSVVFNRGRGPLEAAPNERFARVLGHLVQQIVSVGLYRR